jgi:putative membrane protein
MYGYGAGWHAWGPMMLFGGFFLIVLLIIAVVAVMWLVRGSAYRGHPNWPRVDRASSGLDVLDERYARGELSREEYLQKRRDIAGRGA